MRIWIASSTWTDGCEFCTTTNEFVRLSRDELLADLKASGLLEPETDRAGGHRSVEVVEFETDTGRPVERYTVAAELGILVPTLD